MSIFNRIAGTEDPKIAIWPLMMDFTRVLDSEITFQQFAEIHALSESEQAEAGEYLTRIGQLVTERTAELMVAGIGQPLATVIARGTVDSQLRYGLLRTEIGTIAESQFRTNLGIA